MASVAAHRHTAPVAPTPRAEPNSLTPGGTRKRAKTAEAFTAAHAGQIASSACLGRLRRLAVQDWLLREPNPDGRWDRQIGSSCPVWDVNGTEFWQHAARLGRGAALAAQAHVTSRSGTPLAPERGSATDASGVISETGISAAI